MTIIITSIIIIIKTQFKIKKNIVFENFNLDYFFETIFLFYTFRDDKVLLNLVNIHDFLFIFLTNTITQKIKKSQNIINLFL